MNREEAAALLAAVALGDNRSIDDDAASYWHGLLRDIRVEDALHAVAVHRREATDYLMPAHIVRIVRAERAKRIDAANLVYEPSPDETAREFCLRLAATRHAAADGHTPATPISRMLEPVPAAGALPRGRAAIEGFRTTQGALAIRCPHCQAPPGDRCQTNTKRRHTPDGGTHEARHNAYLAARQEAAP